MPETGRRTTRTPPRSPPWAGGGNGPGPEDDSDPASIACWLAGG